MPVYCPHCATAANIRASVGSNGRMVRCGQCGTMWLARVFEDDPYRRPGATRALVAPADVSDAIVIEHVGAGFESPPQPRPTAQRRRPRPRFTSTRPNSRIAGALAAVAVALLVLGGPLAAGLPRFAAMAGLPEDVNQLAFQKVRSETVQVHGVSTLFVEGEIVNRSDRDVALPAVRISLKSSDGAEVSSWLVEPTTDGLGAGRSIGFRSALASPPSAATQVTLNLAAREGQTIGLR